MAVAYNTLRPVTLPPSPAPSKRALSPAALLIALGFSLLWPSFLGQVIGLMAVLWAGDWFWYKAVATGGVLVGCGLSATVLTGSRLLMDLANPGPTPAAAMGLTVQYKTSRPIQDIRIVPLNVYGIMIDGIPGRDIAWFALGLSRGMSHTQRAWIGLTAPSGQVCDVPYWKGLCKPFRRAELIVGVGPRVAGKVATRSLDAMLSALGLNPGDPELWLLGPASELHAPRKLLQSE